MSDRRPSLFWPILLIGIGLILLLNNAGVLPGSPWAVLWQFWPVLLIVIGVDILFGRSATGRIISAILALLVVVGAIALMASSSPTAPDFLGFLPGFQIGGELKTTHIEYPVSDIQSTDVRIGFSTGENDLYALSDSTNLIEADLSYYGELDVSYSESGGHAELEIGVQRGFAVGAFQPSENWEVGLNPRVTYDLGLSFGVGESNIDLSRLELSGGEINVGVGRTEVRLPDSGRFTLAVHGGVGELRIIAPRDIALRAEVDTGIGSFNNNSRMRSVGDNVYETEGFATAEDAITLIVDVGVGSVTIEDE
jgi:hypothetical protein